MSVHIKRIEDIGSEDKEDTKTEYAAADPILCLYHHCLGELRCAHLMDWPQA